MSTADELRDDYHRRVTVNGLLRLAGESSYRGRLEDLAPGTAQAFLDQAKAFQRRGDERRTAAFARHGVTDPDAVPAFLAEIGHEVIIGTEVVSCSCNQVLGNIMAYDSHIVGLLERTAPPARNEEAKP